MKQWLFILLFFVSTGSFAQQVIADYVKAFDSALVRKDTVYLQRHLHDDLSYGHSNGWVETKYELITHLLNGKLSYHEVESEILSIRQAGNVAIVRTASRIRYVLDGKEGELSLHVMQVWVTDTRGWRMLGRQSAKVH